MLAGDGEGTIVAAHKLQGLLQGALGKTCAEETEIELAHQSPCHGVAMQYGSALCQCQTLQRVSGGVSQVERLADALFCGVFCDDAFLDGHTLCHQLLQQGIVHLVQVEAHQFRPVFCAADERVLYHLCIARKQVLPVKCAQEGGVQKYRPCAVEYTNLVLQSAEVDAGFAAHTGIDHTEQGGGDVDIGHAALEGACGKSAQICDHAAAQIHHETVARGSALLQGCPYGGKRVQCLVLVCGGNGDHLCVLHAGDARHQRPAMTEGFCVREYKQPVVRTGRDGLGEIFFQRLAKDDVLHILYI